MMHASVRVYRSLRSFDEIARRVETDLVPILREIPGFRGYYAIECADGVGVAVGLFDTEQEARISNEKGATWAEENLADLSEGQPPEMLVGRVAVAAVR
jgi:hypothetical protein